MFCGAQPLRGFNHQNTLIFMFRLSANPISSKKRGERREFIRNRFDNIGLEIKGFNLPLFFKEKWGKRTHPTPSPLRGPLRYSVNQARCGTRPLFGGLKQSSLFT